MKIKEKIMKLYGVGKSRSFRALWALEEAGIDYQYVAVTFGSEELNGSLNSEYLELNFQGKVPTLVDGDLTLTESGAIVNRIANKAVIDGLMPIDGSALRSRYDEINYFVLSDLEQGLWTSGKHRFALPEEQRVDAVLKTAAWEFDKAQTALKKTFNGEGFVVGDSFTMADIMLAHTFAWAISFKFDVADEFVTYCERMYQRKACLSALNKLES